MNEGKAIYSDEISNWISIIGISIPIFIFLFTDNNVIWLFPMFLCLAGMAMQYWLVPRRHKKTQQYEIPQKTDDPVLIKNIFFYTMTALASLIVISAITPNFLKISNLELTGADAILFGVMMAIGEERVFRGGLFYRIHYSTKSYLLTGFMTAAIFTVYHLAVYQNDLATMIYVFSAGLLLAYINIIAGVQSPSLIAHVGANILAYSPIGVAGIFGFLTDPIFILLTGAVFALLVILIIFRRKK